MRQVIVVGFLTIVRCRGGKRAGEVEGEEMHGKRGCKGGGGRQGERSFEPKVTDYFPSFSCPILSPAFHSSPFKTCPNNSFTFSQAFAAALGL